MPLAHSSNFASDSLALPRGEDLLLEDAVACVADRLLPSCRAAAAADRIGPEPTALRGWKMGAIALRALCVILLG